MGRLTFEQGVLELRPISDALKDWFNKEPTLSAEEFRTLIGSVIHRVSAPKLREAVRVSYLVGPNHPDKRAQSKDQRRWIKRAIAYSTYEEVCPTCGDRMGAHAGSLLHRDFVGPECCSPKCSANNKERKIRTQATCLRRYGVPHSLQSQEVRKKAAATVQQKYGVRNVSQSPSIKARKEETLRANFGVSNPSESPQIQKSKEKTSWSRYGTRNPAQAEEVKEKARLTCLDRYGVESTGGCLERIQKLQATWASKTRKEIGQITKARRATCEKRYGSQNPMQHEPLARKNFASAHSLKSVEISGIHFDGLQGYEPQALKFLISQGLKANHIKAGRRVAGSFEYLYRGKIRTFYPDFLVGSSTYVEVKSTYTAGLEGSRGNETLAMLRRKMKAVEQSGKHMKVLIGVKDSWILLTTSQFTRAVLLKAVTKLRVTGEPYLRVGDP